MSIAIIKGEYRKKKSGINMGKFLKINYLMRNFLDTYFDNEEKEEDLNNSYHRVQDEVFNLCPFNENELKSNSAENTDFLQYLELVKEIISGNVSPDILKQKYHNYKKVILVDAVLDTYEIIDMMKSKDNMFSIKKVELDSYKKPIIYFDYNAFIRCEEDSKIEENIISLKKDNYFCYSPIHIEEVCKRKNVENHDKIMDIIRQVTDCLFIYVNKDKLDIGKEDPLYSYKRIKMCGSLANKSLEEYRILRNKDKVVYNSEYVDKAYKSRINSLDILQDEEVKKIFDVNLRKYGYSIDDILNKFDFTSNNISYARTNNVIYAIMNSMMDMSYKNENKDKTIKSGLYDIEHLIYAVKCNRFVTSDKKLMDKAKIVFKLLNLNIRVSSMDDFIKEVNM